MTDKTTDHDMRVAFAEMLEAVRRIEAYCQDEGKAMIPHYVLRKALDLALQKHAKRKDKPS